MEETRYETLKTKVAQIIVPEWDWSIDLDEILQIRYDNIFGEVITIPILENRAGRLLSEMREYKKREKLKLEMKEAEVRKLFRNKRSADGHKPPTVQESEDAILLDPVIKNMRYNLISLEKMVEDLEVFYDAVKSKAFKLNNLSKSLHPEEYENELMEGKVNNIMIKLRSKKYS